MAGFTGFSCGHVNNDLVYIPLNEICSKKYTNTIQPNDRHWQRLLASTG
jgi:6-phosphofructokinase 1